MCLETLLIDLLEAYRLASENKRTSENCIRFETCFEEEISSLAHAILARTYTISPCSCFVVTSPVKREIVAAEFRDRVVHHYIHHYIAPHLERLLITDCYSCRPGKGTHFGVNRLEHHIRSASQNYTRPAYCLQLDIQGYFMHINRQLLYQKAMKLMERIGETRNAEGILLRDQPKHEHVAYLLKIIIMHDPIQDCIYKGNTQLFAQIPHEKTLHHSPPGCGLPIGNLTSQLFSNLYLNDFDHYVKRTLKIKHYGRYVDDFFLIDTDREKLMALIPVIKNRLKTEYGLDIHPHKIQLQEVKKGITFLGIHLKPYRRYLSKSARKRIYHQVKSLNNTPEKELSCSKVRAFLLSSANSYLGILNATASYKFKRLCFRHSILFKIAYGTSFMQKFVLTN